MGEKMKRFMLMFLMAMTLVACNKKDSTIVCGDYDVTINMAADGETITAVINGDEMTLQHAISASGARYVGELNDTVVTLWNQGTEWTLFFNEDVPISCTIK